MGQIKTTGFGIIDLSSEAMDTAFAPAVEAKVAALFLGVSEKRSR
jgi:hypothetical protein